MKSKYIFFLGNNQFQIPKDLQILNKLQGKISSILLQTGIYYVSSNVHTKNFECFLNFLTEKTSYPKVSVDNFYEYLLLNKEFNNILADHLNKNEFDELKKISILNSAISCEIRDKSICILDIAKNLDIYIALYEKKMSRIPISVLYNIFFHSERNLMNHEKAYQFIIKTINSENKNKIDICVLLNSLDGSKLSEKSFKESISKRNEHFGFMPKNNLTFINSFNQSVAELSFSMKKSISDLKHHFDIKIENIQNSIKSLSEENNCLKINLQQMQTYIKNITQQISKENNEILDKIKQTSKENKEALEKIQQTSKENKEALEKIQQTSRENKKILDIIKQTYKENKETLEKIQQNSKENKEVLYKIKQASIENKETLEQIQQASKENKEDLKKIQQASDENKGALNAIQKIPNKIQYVVNGINQYPSKFENIQKNIQLLLNCTKEIPSNTMQLMFNKIYDNTLSTKLDLMKKLDCHFKYMQYINNLPLKIKYNEEWRSDGIFKIFFSAVGNPFINGDMRIRGNSEIGFEKSLICLCDPYNKYEWKSRDEYNSYIEIDFKRKFKIQAIKLTHPLLYYHSFFEVSIDGKISSIWENDLVNLKSDSQISDCIYTVNLPNHYRYIRIRMLGKNSSDNYQLCLQNFDFYGEFI